MLARGARPLRGRGRGRGREARRHGARFLEDELGVAWSRDTETQRHGDIYYCPDDVKNSMQVSTGTLIYLKLGMYSSFGGHTHVIVRTHAHTYGPYLDRAVQQTLHVVLCKVSSRI